MHKVLFQAMTACLVAGGTLLATAGLTTACKRSVSQPSKVENYVPYVRRSPETPRSFAGQAVFKVKIYDFSRPESGGTGFLIETETGGKVIVTNRHVCENPDASAKLYYLEQGSESFVGKMRAKSLDTDLCIIKAPEEIMRTRRGYKLADRALIPGENVRVFGHPYLRPLTLWEGRYENESEERMGLETLSFDAGHIMLIGRLSFMVHPGNSGSPLLNDEGDVVGVIFAMEGATRNGLFIPVSELKKFLAVEQ